jgi:hypothetical protein
LSTSLVVSRQRIYKSHWHFRSHMESSFRRLIPFLALILRLTIPTSLLNSIPGSYPGSLASRLCSLLLYHVSESKSKSHCDWRCQSVRKSWCRAPSEVHDQTYLLLFDSYGLVFVGRPLWREDGYVFCILWRVMPLETPFGLVICLLQSSPTRNYIHLQLFITLLPVYTITILTCQYSILYIFTYSHFEICPLTAS